MAPNEYDDSGRLISSTDAAGFQLHFEHDLDLRQEVTRDRLGNVTVLLYNNDGQLLRQTDVLGGVTSRTYDTQVISHRY